MPDDLPLPAETPDPAKKHSALWQEIKGIIVLVLAVLIFHSLIAKPFYIPSESMLPTLRVGDRLVVSKYPYGWSYVSPSFHVLPFIKGRLFETLPQRGDIVIVKPVNQSSDYIKRLIGLPGDRLEMRNGTLLINGAPVKRTPAPDALIPVDANAPCDKRPYLDRQVLLADGKRYCRLPIMRETLPNGVSFDTVDLMNRETDTFMPLTVPEGHVFLMGDNRDDSADSRVSLEQDGLGGPVPFENIGGRAEFVTFSLDGSTIWWNPATWFSAVRAGRSGTSLRPQMGEE